MAANTESIFAKSVRLARGFLFVLLLLYLGVMVVIFGMIPWVPLLLVPATRGLYRSVVSTVTCSWLVLGTILVDYISPMKVVVSGAPFAPSDKRVIVICNHRCDVDWSFFWMYCFRVQRLHSMKIVAKALVRFVPPIGWAMQMVRYLFVSRTNTDSDIQYLKDMVGYLVDNGENITLFIFPEGTDLDVNSLRRSHQFSESKGLPKYNYVMHPKVKGFVQMIGAMKEKNSLDAVYDMTIGYRNFADDASPSMLAYLLGRFPSVAHLNIQRTDANDFPTSVEDQEEWCRARFALKEKRLANFYESEKFEFADLEDESKPAPVVRTPRHISLTAASDFLSLGFCVLFSLYWSYVMTYSTLACVWFWMGFAIIVGMSYFGGFDTFELSLHQKEKKGKMNATPIQTGAGEIKLAGPSSPVPLNKTVSPQGASSVVSEPEKETKNSNIDDNSNDVQREEEATIISESEVLMNPASSEINVASHQEKKDN